MELPIDHLQFFNSSFYLVFSTIPRQRFISFAVIGVNFFPLRLTSVVLHISVTVLFFFFFLYCFIFFFLYCFKILQKIHSTGYLICFYYVRRRVFSCYITIYRHTFRVFENRCLRKGSFILFPHVEGFSSCFLISILLNSQFHGGGGGVLHGLYYLLFPNYRMAAGFEFQFCSFSKSINCSCARSILFEETFLRQSSAVTLYS